MVAVVVGTVAVAVGAVPLQGLQLLLRLPNALLQLLAALLQLLLAVAHFLLPVAHLFVAVAHLRVQLLLAPRAAVGGGGRTFNPFQLCPHPRQLTVYLLALSGIQAFGGGSGPQAAFGPAQAFQLQAARGGRVGAGAKATNAERAAELLAEARPELPAKLPAKLWPSELHPALCPAFQLLPVASIGAKNKGAVVGLHRRQHPDNLHLLARFAFCRLALDFNLALVCLGGHPLPVHHQVGEAAFFVFRNYHRAGATGRGQVHFAVIDDDAPLFAHPARAGLVGLVLIDDDFADFVGGCHRRQRRQGR